MISAAQCRDIAKQYKILSSVPNISEDRAFLLRNIARTFAGAAGQLDRLEALTRGEQAPMQVGKVTCPCRFPPVEVRVRPSEGRTDEASQVY
ncbi:hypothetical protein, partial [Bradyrhizobium sp. G22]|uniref:hypothetical protein n=1 Tax=Bradyrhizobium sp. G22 TaxID=1839752 RepID=UPI001A8DBEF0